MKRSQKKANLKAKKRRAKEARKARNAAAETAAESTHQASAKNTANVEADSAPAKLAEQDLRHRARDSRAFMTEAGRLNAEARKPGVSDERAVELIQKAAEFAEFVIDIARETLEEVPAERRLEAAGVIREERERRANPEAYEDGRKRPRRGSDPVVTLMKLGMQASGLLNRIVSRINPDAYKLARAA